MMHIIVCNVNNTFKKYKTLKLLYCITDPKTRLFANTDYTSFNKFY